MWRGEFEPDGTPQLFGFDVPLIYKGIKSSDLDESEISGPFSDGIFDYYVINLQTKCGPRSFCAERVEYRPDLTVYFANHHIDNQGELWIQKVDDIGNLFPSPVQDRDIVYQPRENMLELLTLFGDVDDVTLECLSHFPRDEYPALFTVLSKKPSSTYSDRGRSELLDRLHISQNDLSQWAQKRSLALPFLRTGAISPPNSQSLTRRGYSPRKVITADTAVFG